MNVVVSNGSYKFNYRREIYRAVVVDEENNIYVSNYNGFLLFPGYVANNDKSCNINKVVNDIFGTDVNSELHCKFEHYYLSKYKNIFGKRLSSNNLDITYLYIVRINSNDIKELDESIVKLKYSDLLDKVNSSDYERYTEEMLVQLKLLPEDIKGRKDFRVMIKKKGNN